MPQLLQFKTFPVGLEEETGLRPQLESLKKAVSDFLEDGALRLAAALSYYTILSFAPLLLVVVGIAGYVGGRQAIAQQLIEQATTLVGPVGGELAKAVLMSADEPRKGFIAIVTGIVTLLIGATGVFGQLQDALNIIWEVERKPGGGVWSLIRSRLLSFAMVIGIGFMLLVSLVLSAAITLLQNHFASSIGHGLLWQVINVGVSLIVMSVLFGLMFKLLPDVYIAWRDVVFGAIVTGLLVTIGKFAIGLYLGHSSVGSAYGAAGSLVVLLVWIYYTSLIVLFGAELTQAYARKRGTAIRPKPHAKLREC
jgi:membrane protein